MTAANVEEYLAGFDEPAQAVLRELRRAILAADPGAPEAIRYQMPAWQLGGRTWLHLGGWRRHAGLYPVPPIPELEDRIAPYRTTTGTVAFPYAAPVPYDLVGQIATALAAADADAGR